MRNWLYGRRALEAVIDGCILGLIELCDDAYVVAAYYMQAQVVDYNPRVGGKDALKAMVQHNVDGVVEALETADDVAAVVSDDNDLF